MLFFCKRCAYGRPSGIDETQIQFPSRAIAHSHFNILKVSIHKKKELPFDGSLRHAVLAAFMEAVRGCLNLINAAVFTLLCKPELLHINCFISAQLRLGFFMSCNSRSRQSFPRFQSAIFQGRMVQVCSAFKSSGRERSASRPELLTSDTLKLLKPLFFSLTLLGFFSASPAPSANGCCLAFRRH